MNFELKKYEPTEKSDWDTFVLNGKNSSFLFYRDFMDYHSERFEDHSLMVFKDEVLFAVLPANLHDGMLHSHQGLSYGGLVLSKESKFSEVLFAFKEVLVYLETEGIKTLHIKLLPKIYHHLPSDEMDYLLFKLKANISRRDLTSVIDSSNRLKIDSSNRKRGIKKGIKNGLMIKEEQDFQSFWNEILIPNLKATHQTSPVHSLDEISLLKSRFPDNIRQFNVYKESDIVGGATIFENDTVAHVQYISAGTNKQQLGSLDFLFDYLINNEFKEKAYFDFGISNENRGERINDGLLSWKESFGGRSILHDFYEIKTENHVNLNDVLI